MKKIIFSAITLLMVFQLSAQNGAAKSAATKFFTKTGKVYFSATSSIEKIEATTGKAVGIVDIAAGKVEAKVLVKSFHFEKALMEEHFNENYMESGKYPDAVFVGNITDAKSVNLAKDGAYTVKVNGKLTMHNVTKDVETTANLTVKGGAITMAKSDFSVKLSDYNIAIPTPVKDKIAKEAKISIDLALQPLK
jgi:polyisoprenoid-binding protein YceI